MAEHQEQKSTNILLVEDDKYLMHACKDALELSGFSVDMAETGVGALDQMRRKKPDFVLLDIIIPDKNGFEVLEEMRMDDELRDIPVLIFSNLGQKSDIEKGKSFGALDYLVKSDFSMKEIITKIREYVAETKK